MIPGASQNNLKLHSKWKIMNILMQHMNFFRRQR